MEALRLRPRFSTGEADSALNDWSFNCGPGALCAVLNKTPDEIRPHLLDFESKGYTNPTLMASILRGLGVSFKRTFESQVKPMIGSVIWPKFGLVRIQWSGPWCNPGVPMAARYRATHWISYQSNGGISHDEVFDINAMRAGGWISFAEWGNELVPWLLPQVQPKADGEWWPTHCWDIEPTRKTRSDVT